MEDKFKQNVIGGGGLSNTNINPLQHNKINDASGQESPNQYDRFTQVNPYLFKNNISQIRDMNALLHDKFWDSPGLS